MFISFFCVNLIFNGYLVSSEEENNHRCVESCKEGEQERFYDHCYFWSKPKSVWADPAKKIGKSLILSAIEGTEPLQRSQAWKYTTSCWERWTKKVSVRIPSFGSVGQTRRQRATGNGSMEVIGTLPIGQPKEKSNHVVAQIRTVCRYIMVNLPQTDGTTNIVPCHFRLSAAGKFAQV